MEQVREWIDAAPLLCRDYVQSAVFVSELGALQVYLQLEAFHGSSKQALVCSLLQNHADSPRVRGGALASTQCFT